VAARLKPALQLPVVEEQHAVPGCGHHEGAARQVAFAYPPIEGVGVARDERAYACEVRRFFLVGGLVGRQRLLEVHGALILTWGPAVRLEVV
jgi:hypothetical protein